MTIPETTYELTVPDHRFTIELERDDIDRFMPLASQFLGGLSNEKVVWLTTRNNWRYWIASYRHSVVRAAVRAQNLPDGVMIPFTEKTLLTLYDFLSNYERCDITVEYDEVPQRYVLIISANGDSFCADIPPIVNDIPDVNPSGDTWCDLENEKAGMLSEFIRCWPSQVQPDSIPAFLPAFAHLTVDTGGVKCTMDWSRYEGTLSTISLGGKSHGAGTVQFDGYLVSRVFGRAIEEEALRVTFESSDPSVVYLHNDHWCFMVKAHRECVVRWVWPVKGFLADKGIEVDAFDTVSDVPLLSFMFVDSPMEISFCIDPQGNDDFMRVTMLVAESVAAGLELMNEMNMYNNATNGVSALINGGRLFLAADVACVDFESGLMPALKRLHRHRHDLTPAIAMFGDNALFDSSGD